MSFHTRDEKVFGWGKKTNSDCIYLTCDKGPTNSQKVHSRNQRIKYRYCICIHIYGIWQIPLSRTRNYRRQKVNIKNYQMKIWSKAKAHLLGFRKLEFRKLLYVYFSFLLCWLELGLKMSLSRKLNI